MGTRIVARWLGALLLLVGACAPAGPGDDRPVGSGSSRLTPLFRLDSTGLAAEDNELLARYLRTIM